MKYDTYALVVVLLVSAAATPAAAVGGSNVCTINTENVVTQDDGTAKLVDGGEYSVSQRLLYPEAESGAFYEIRTAGGVFDEYLKADENGELEIDAGSLSENDYELLGHDGSLVLSFSMHDDSTEDEDNDDQTSDGDEEEEEEQSTSELVDGGEYEVSDRLRYNDAVGGATYEIRTSEGAFVMEETGDGCGMFGISSNSLSEGDYELHNTDDSAHVLSFSMYDESTEDEQNNGESQSSSANTVELVDGERYWVRQELVYNDAKPETMYEIETGDSEFVAEVASDEDGTFVLGSGQLTTGEHVVRGLESSSGNELSFAVTEQAIAVNVDNETLHVQSNRGKYNATVDIETLSPNETARMIDGARVDGDVVMFDGAQSRSAYNLNTTHVEDGTYTIHIDVADTEAAASTLFDVEPQPDSESETADNESSMTDDRDEQSNEDDSSSISEFVNRIVSWLAG